MSETLQIKTDAEMRAALFQLFAMANMDPPEKEIKASDVLLALREIKTQLKAAGSGTPATPASGRTQPLNLDGTEGSEAFAQMASMVQGEAPRPDLKQENILIVGELGIITFQLKLSLSKLGAGVTIVKGIDEAISEYQKRNYTGVLIDIFMPTEREGLLVLMEIKRLEKEKPVRTDIVVLATPVKEKSSDLKEVCRQRGASVFLEKTEGWHQKVIDIFSGTYNFNNY